MRIVIRVYGMFALRAYGPHKVFVYRVCCVVSSRERALMDDVVVDVFRVLYVMMVDARDRDRDVRRESAHKER